MYQDKQLTRYQCSRFDMSLFYNYIIIIYIYYKPNSSKIV